MRPGAQDLWVLGNKNGTRYLEVGRASRARFHVRRMLSWEATGLLYIYIIAYPYYGAQYSIEANVYIVLDRASGLPYITDRPGVHH